MILLRWGLPVSCPLPIQNTILQIFIIQHFLLSAFIIFLITIYLQILIFKRVFSVIKFIFSNFSYQIMEMKDEQFDSTWQVENDLYTKNLEKLFSKYANGSSSFYKTQGTIENKEKKMVERKENQQERRTDIEKQNAASETEKLKKQMILEAQRKKFEQFKQGILNDNYIDIDLELPEKQIQYQRKVEKKSKIQIQKSIIEEKILIQDPNIEQKSEKMSEKSEGNRKEVIQEEIVKEEKPSTEEKSIPEQKKSTEKKKKQSVQQCIKRLRSLKREKQIFNFNRRKQNST